MSSERPRIYLEKYLEPKLSRVGRRYEKAQVASLYTALGVVDYEQDEVTLYYGDYDLSMQFEPLAIDNVSENTFNRYQYYTGGLWTNYILRAFHLKNTRSSTSFTLNEVIPRNTTVVIDPYENPLSSYVSRDKEQITLGGNLACPVTWITLAHEVGHLINPFSKNEETRMARIVFEDALYARDAQITHPEYVPMKSSPHHLATVLRDERNAWAFAFNKLSPLFNPDGPLTQEGFFALMHQQLRSYSRDIETFLHRR